MERAKVLEILEKTEVLLEGHFKLTSGRHSKNYLQCAKLFQYPEYAEIIAKDMAERYKGIQVDYVVGPAIGGIVWSYELARQMGVKNIFAERENGEMSFRRGFQIQNGDQVVIAEDVITTGGSVKEVIEKVLEAGGKVVGVATVVNRSKMEYLIDYPIQSMISFDIETYEAEHCPMCQNGIPCIKPGSRNI